MSRDFGGRDFAGRDFASRGSASRIFSSRDSGGRISPSRDPEGRDFASRDIATRRNILVFWFAASAPPLICGPALAFPPPTLQIAGTIPGGPRSSARKKPRFYSAITGTSK